MHIIEDMNKKRAAQMASFYFLFKISLKFIYKVFLLLVTFQRIPLENLKPVICHLIPYLKINKKIVILNKFYFIIIISGLLVVNNFVRSFCILNHYLN